MALATSPTEGGRLEISSTYIEGVVYLGIGIYYSGEYTKYGEVLFRNGGFEFSSHLMLLNLFKMLIRKSGFGGFLRQDSFSKRDALIAYQPILSEAKVSGSFHLKELSGHKFSIVRFIPCSLDRFIHLGDRWLNKGMGRFMSLIKNYTSRILPEKVVQLQLYVSMQLQLYTIKKRNKILIMMLLTKIIFDEK